MRGEIHTVWKLSGLLMSTVALISCGSDDGVLGRFRVEGHAMSPTMEDGDYVETIDYDGRTPGRGDVIIFAAPTSVSRLFIKRVIGLPGDTIVIDEAASTVRVNGVRLDEPYARGPTVCSYTCSWTMPSAQADLSISEDTYEPRAGATPSAEDQACEERGCYFVLGDNRQNSSDSRQGWLVPSENIAGYIVGE